MSVQNIDIIPCARGLSLNAIHAIKGKPDCSVTVWKCNCPFTIDVDGIGCWPARRVKPSTVTNQTPSATWLRHYRWLWMYYSSKYTQTSCFNYRLSSKLFIASVSILLAHNNGQDWYKSKQLTWVILGAGGTGISDSVGVGVTFCITVKQEFSEIERP